MDGVAVSDGSHIGAANGWARIAVTIRHHQAPSPSGGTLHRPVLAMPTKHEAACLQKGPSAATSSLGAFDGRRRLRCAGISRQMSVRQKRPNETTRGRVMQTLQRGIAEALPL